MKVIATLAAALLLAACGSVAPLTSSGSPASDSPGTTPAPVVSKAVSLKGSHSKVLKVQLASLTYIVNWTAKGGQCFGSAGCNGDNFVVDVVGADGAEDNIVNEITSNNVKKGSTGETTYTIHDAGLYLLKVDASELTWTITFTPI